jgi:hypothetical protein
MIARGRKRRNFIPSLTLDGHLISDHVQMEQAMCNHFTEVFGRAASGGTTINFDALGLMPLQLEDLEADFDDAEVWNAIKAMSADRAHGPDGFMGAFYKLS